MALRVIIAGVVAGILMFCWEGFSHAMTALGTAGFRSAPLDGSLEAAVSRSVTEPGLYFYPGIEESRMKDAAAREEWMAKAQSGPSGLLLYNAKAESMSPRQLGSELGVDVVICLIAAGMVAGWAAAGGFARRWLFVAILGLLPGLAVLASYWIWFGFPTAFVLAGALESIVGFALAGLPIAAIVRRRS